METAPPKPVSLWAIRSSIWSVLLTMLGTGVGMLFDHAFSGPNTLFGVVIGTFAGSTALAVRDYRQRNASSVWIVMGVVAIVWIVGLRIIESR